ncbi:hypothetical protein F5Y14DRAFT_440964 [Nemania sp. NC0429]|nr:hypothetical protein F5Y14DRAFT_440964 [Nemania sp. NC0429]
MSCSRLENLPAELKTEILQSMPDLMTLRSIVHASPIIHAQYRYDRHKILSTCLEREFEGFYVDAYANLKSRVSELGILQDTKLRSDFVRSYKGWLRAADHYPDAKSLPPSRVRWMVAYHTSVARPFVSRYSSWALANLRNGTEPQNCTPRDGNESVLSRSEEIHILRALYRFETFHHIFGLHYGRRRGSFRDWEVRDMFFDLFDPWESEGIGCINTFVRQQWEDIFDRVHTEFDADPMGTTVTSSSAHHRTVRSHTNPYRADYLDVRMSAIENYDILLSKMDLAATLPVDIDAPILRCMEGQAELHRRCDSSKFPRANDEAEQRQESMEFSGDMAPPKGPPLAWVLLWDGRYANIFGELLPESLRQMGYVMWDSTRLADTGSEKLVRELNEWEPSGREIQRVLGCRSGSSVPIW